MASMPPLRHARSPAARRPVRRHRSSRPCRAPSTSSGGVTMQAAAEAYRDVLAAQAGAMCSALLGLERVLLPLNRSAEILPAARAALAADPVQLRALRRRPAGVGRRRPAGQRARHRGAVGPDSADRRDALSRVGRRRALAAESSRRARCEASAGRQRLGRPDALAAEMAQLALADGDYATAAREWLPAVRRLPGYRITAVATLGHAPAFSGGELLRILAADTGFRRPAARVGASARSGATRSAASGARGRTARSPAVRRLDALAGSG